METPTLIAAAERALEGRHPKHDFLINNGTEKATAYALVALAREQRTTNAQLASIAVSLDQIARALTARGPAAEAAPPAEEPDPAPARRRWFTRR